MSSVESIGVLNLIPSLLNLASRFFEKNDHHIKILCCYISVSKVPKGLKIKVTSQTPGIKTNNFYRRWDIILFECSTRLLKLLLDDASYQKKGLGKIFSDLLKTSEEQLSTDDFTNICRLDEIQKLEDTKFSKKRDAKFKRDGIKSKTPIDSTEDTVVRKMRTRRFRRKTKAENKNLTWLSIFPANL